MSLGSILKKRGVDVSPEELRRTLMQGHKTKKPASGEHLTLVLTRVGDARYAIVPVPPSLPRPPISGPPRKSRLLGLMALRATSMNLMARSFEPSSSQT